MNKFASRPAVVLLAVAIVAVAGCKASRDCNLTGKVSFQGKPVIYGTVLVQCADGTRLATNIKADGTYLIEGLLAGPVKIGVNSPEPPDAAALATAPRSGPASAPPNL